MKYKIKNLQQTCEAFPAQWEGRTFCDKYVYVRYRFGSLQLSVAETEDGAVRGGDNCSDSVYVDYGDQYSGILKLEDLTKLAKDFFNFEKCLFEDKNEKFYIYTIPSDMLKSPEYNPCRTLEKMQGDKIVLGKTVMAEIGAQEVTADKKKFIVDPSREIFILKNIKR